MLKKLENRGQGPSPKGRIVEAPESTDLNPVHQGKQDACLRLIQAHGTNVQAGLTDCAADLPFPDLIDLFKAVAGTTFKDGLYAPPKSKERKAAEAAAEVMLQSAALILDQAGVAFDRVGNRLILRPDPSTELGRLAADEHGKVPPFQVPFAPSKNLEHRGWAVCIGQERALFLSPKAIARLAPTAFEDHEVDHGAFYRLAFQGIDHPLLCRLTTGSGDGPYAAGCLLEELSTYAHQWRRDIETLAFAGDLMRSGQLGVLAEHWEAVLFAAAQLRCDFPEGPEPGPVPALVKDISNAVAEAQRFQPKEHGMAARFLSGRAPGQLFDFEVQRDEGTARDVLWIPIPVDDGQLQLVFFDEDMVRTAKDIDNGEHGKKGVRALCEEALRGRIRPRLDVLANTTDGQMKCYEDMARDAGALALLLDAPDLTKKPEEIVLPPPPTEQDRGRLERAVESIDALTRHYDDLLATLPE